MTLQERLEDLGEDYYPFHEYGSGYSKENKERVNQATQAIEKDILELIGDDHKITGLEPLETEDFYATRNKLKSELRLKLKEYFDTSN
jgi:hypothetical protein